MDQKTMPDDIPDEVLDHTPHTDTVEKMTDESFEELYNQIESVFQIYDAVENNGSLFFYGIPNEDSNVIFQKLWTPFAEKGYQFTIKYELGEHILVASPFVEKRERVWINVVLALATVFTTMLVGAEMFGVDLASAPSQIIQGLPFTIAIMTVLGSHEMGHYIAARMHGMHTSLPYFIPVPTIIGTMGAIIKHRGPIPSRKALFDVGVSGPLIGLAASILVTIIGLNLPPVIPSQDMMMMELQNPPLFTLLMNFVGSVGEFIHPVAFAGWVGMLVTMLNLLPSGQLDGGHVLRAMMGENAKYVSSIMPYVLLTIGIYVTYIMKQSGFIWIVWALFLSFFAAAGHPTPLNDEIELDNNRMAVGVITFVLGLLCFTFVPFTFIQ
ncbi:MAG TPA: site-2 protease family protein [Methanosarcinaceae archaeon]|nr:site-2 protease family protein [Methanosarcinaceae archaeon]